MQTHDRLHYKQTKPTKTLGVRPNNFSRVCVVEYGNGDMKGVEGHIWFSNESVRRMGAFLKFHPGE